VRSSIGTGSDEIGAKSTESVDRGPQVRKKEAAMDILYVAITLVFFGVTGALINFLGKL